jgi:catechol 2,3-dioxygenase-like lactoylglutathione lyase family enzyme
MFDHVGLRVADLGSSRRFYETALATLGIGSPTHADDELVEWHDFDLSPATAEQPDGNSAEAVHHDDVGPPGHVDHLWIRVADVAAARAFYLAIAPYAGLRPGTDEPERAQFTGAGGSFSLVAGDEPTEQVHIAFPAPDLTTVEAFHRTAIEAGYADNGAPGERPQYHPGYHGAFVLDPDGNNVEVVFHDRG